MLGKLAADQLRGNDHCTIRFTNIECLPPPCGTGFESCPWQQDPVKFLAEVQFYGQMRNQLQLPDDDLKQRLEVAFAKHSWVEKVEQIDIESGHVRVHLAYRFPVLIVKMPDRMRPDRIAAWWTVAGFFWIRLERLASSCRSCRAE